jgi:hypothetical protein
MDKFTGMMFSETGLIAMIGGRTGRRARAIRKRRAPT